MTNRISTGASGMSWIVQWREAVEELASETRWVYDERNDILALMPWDEYLNQRRILAVCYTPSWVWEASAKGCV